MKPSFVGRLPKESVGWRLDFPKTWPTRSSVQSFNSSHSGRATEPGMGDAWQWQSSRVEDYCSLQGISSVNIKAALNCDFLIEMSDAVSQPSFDIDYGCFGIFLWKSIWCQKHFEIHSAVQEIQRVSALIPIGRLMHLPSCFPFLGHGNHSMEIWRWLLIKLVVVPGYPKSYRFVLKKLRCSTSAGETSASAHTFEMPRATSHGHLPGLVTSALPLKANL